MAVEATPLVRPGASPIRFPTKEVAVIIPVGALMPEELIVVAEPTVNEVMQKLVASVILVQCGCACMDP